VLEAEPEPLDQLRPAVAPELSRVIMRCLRKDRNERFNDVATLASALSPFGSVVYSGYPARCRANLNDETLGHRLTLQTQPIADTSPDLQFTVSRPVSQPRGSHHEIDPQPGRSSHSFAALRTEHPAAAQSVVRDRRKRSALLVASVLAASGVIGAAAGVSYPLIQSWLSQLDQLVSVWHTTQPTLQSVPVNSPQPARAR